MAVKPIKDVNDLAQAGGLDAVGAAIDAAKVVSLPGSKRRAAADQPFDKAQDRPGQPTAAARRGRAPRGPGQAEPRLPMLPEGCPVVPLGMRKQTYFFLDALGQLIDLNADKVAQRGIMSLFGERIDLPQSFWPRFGKADDKTGEAKVTGVEWNHATMALMSCAAREGVFDERNRVRGRGAHKGADGELILHCGDALWIGPPPSDPPDEAGGGEWRRPGVIETRHGVGHAMVYPTGARLPRPAIDPANREAAEYLVGLFGTWNFKRAVDPVLLLGAVVQMMIGGALSWRAIVWVTGDSAAGKSTLLDTIDLVMGGELLKMEDATEAFIRQELDHDTIPVALDEAEPEESNTKINAMIKLARLATGGGMGGRGGSDHKSKAFILKSCFLMSSVLLPPSLTQDRNRMAILELGKLPQPATTPLIDAATMRNTGAALRRRIRDQWPRFAPTLDYFRQLLADRGHIGRGANVFGTLLACAHLTLYDDVAAPVGGMEARSDAQNWADQLAADRLSELADEMSNADRCAAHLASSPLAGVSGAAPMSVGWWCLKSLDLGATGDPKARLGAVGMRVVRRAPVPGEDGCSISDPPLLEGVLPADRLAEQLYLAVASAHRGLDPLFRDTQWQGRAGAAGGWGQALRRVDGAIAGERVRIDGKTAACTLVPLARLVDLGREGEE